MQKIKFFGAAGTVTGSSFLLTSGKDQFLIDFGMFQGPEEISRLNFSQLELDGRSLSGVVVTHAHLDHCGRLPLLVQKGFTQKVYMTQATQKLVELSLLDSAKIGRNDHDTQPLYDENDVRTFFNYIKTVEYGQEFTVGQFHIILRDAGHILGSSSVEVDISGKKIVFSGDLGNNPEPLMKPTEYIRQADVVVMESTYGDRCHAQEDSQKILQAEINTVEQTGGVLLIPAFSLERTQVLLYMIDILKRDKKVLYETPVFLDSPMGITATDIYSEFPHLYNKELFNHSRCDDPFNFPGLFIVKKASKSKKIRKIKGPKVIIAGSGMMMGGRILLHAGQYLSQKTTRLLIVGYMGEETLGREIQEGIRRVVIGKQMIHIRATITEIQGLSAHADQSQLLSWLKHIKGVQKVFLVHGENEPRKLLAQKIKNETNICDVIMPKLYDEMEII